MTCARGIKAQRFVIATPSFFPQQWLHCFNSVNNIFFSNVAPLIHNLIFSWQLVIRHLSAHANVVSRAFSLWVSNIFPRWGLILKQQNDSFKNCSDVEKPKIIDLIEMNLYKAEKENDVNSVCFCRFCQHSCLVGKHYWFKCRNS